MLINCLHFLNQSRCAPGLFRHFPAGKSEEPIFFIFHFSFFTRNLFFPWGRKFSLVGPQIFPRCFGLTVQRYDIKFPKCPDLLVTPMNISEIIFLNDCV